MQDKKLYILRKLSSDNGDNHLIAVLSKDESGEYRLWSMLDGSPAAQEYALPILSKTVGENAQAAIRKWLGGFLPPLDNKPVMSALLDRFGMTEFDEWEWLKHYSPEGRNLISFSETLPPDVIRHDPEDECADDEYDEFDDKYDGPDDSYDDGFYQLFSDEQSSCCWNYDDYSEEYDEEFGDNDDEDEMSEDESIDQPAAECPDSPRLPLKDFIDQQEANIVTDKDTIRNAFMSLLDVSLKAFFARLKNPDAPITEISDQYGIPLDKARELTVNDIINRLRASTKLHIALPRLYSQEARTVYSALSLQLAVVSQIIPITF